jgi:hypothetical protein
MRRMIALAALALGGLATSGTLSAGAEEAPAPKLKRVVQAIELSTKKGTPFRGRLWLGVASSAQKPPATGQSPPPSEPAPPPLTYYWGGKCKDTDVPPSRLELLMQAMKEGYAVEIHAFPIEHAKSVVMCMQSARIAKD